MLNVLLYIYNVLILESQLKQNNKQQ